MRKQVHELSIADLQASPAWEFAHDEEHVEGQDEATVRPLVFDDAIDPAAGALVRCRFQLADGSQHLGYLTPSSDRTNDLGSLQPVVVTPRGQVVFWCGRIAPSRNDLDRAYRELGASDSSRVFPVRFWNDVRLTCGEIRGLIDGFLVLEDWRTGRTRVVR